MTTRFGRCTRIGSIASFQIPGSVLALRVPPREILSAPSDDVTATDASDFGDIVFAASVKWLPRDTGFSPCLVFANAEFSSSHDGVFTSSTIRDGSFSRSIH